MSTAATRGVYAWRSFAVLQLPHDKTRVIYITNIIKTPFSRIVPSDTQNEIEKR